jgi:hypothetical protein
MNTLNLKLLAASMFAFSAAFAQETVPTAKAQTRNKPVISTPTDIKNNIKQINAAPRKSYGADSYVLQHGDNQYANVDQNGFFNTADIYQGNTNAKSSGNNATQKQINDGRDNTGKVNVAYIDQEGTNSSASQYQKGSDNVASTTQGTGNGNYAIQNQTGLSNKANISQNGSTSAAYQTQDGDMDNAKITQGTAAGNYAEQRQSGGNGNQANTTQSAYYGTFSYTEQVGNNNQATVNQHFN